MFWTSMYLMYVVLIYICNEFVISACADQKIIKSKMNPTLWISKPTSKTCSSAGHRSEWCSDFILLEQEGKVWVSTYSL
jgi:hypothetical protein